MHLPWYGSNQKAFLFLAQPLLLLPPGKKLDPYIIYRMPVIVNHFQSGRYTKRLFLRKVSFFPCFPGRGGGLWNQSDSLVPGLGATGADAVNLPKMFGKLIFTPLPSKSVRTFLHKYLINEKLDFPLTSV